jgi:hypoxanthine phosphoribosyltransferase
MMNQSNDLWITWDVYHRQIEELALKIADSNLQFDQLLCLARGGLRIGDVLSRILKLPLATLAISSYRENSGLTQGTLETAQHISMTGSDLSGRILVVDDLVDSGETLKATFAYLQEHHPQVQEVHSAVIWYKACSPVAPDFFVEFLAHNPWIHQPFEVYDTLSTEQLREKLKQS